MGISKPLRPIDGWKWISSARCTEAEIVFAQAEGDRQWFVNDDGLGFVLVPPDDPRLGDLSDA